jgi:hypothetical protein
MAVAFVALLAALGGTAVALPGSNNVTSGDIKRGAVGSSDLRNNSASTTDIRNNTIRGGDVRTNSLTGSDINEGSLGTVPSANTANSANTASSASSAGNANTVGGRTVRSVLAAIPLGTLTQQTIVSLNGFSLTATCDAAGTPTLTMTTTRNDTQAQFAHTNGANAPVGARTTIDAGETFDADEAQTNGSGTFTWGTRDGATLSVTMSFDEDDAFGAFNGCAFVGSAIG